MSNARVSARPDRRRFLKVAGLVSLSSALATPLAFAQSGSSDAKPPARPPAKPLPPPAPPAGDAAEISPEARALARIVRERYGQHLSEAQIHEIEKELTWRMRAGATLRQLKLANGDEPDFAFKA